MSELRQVVLSAISERGFEHILDAIQVNIHVSHIGHLGWLDANNVHIGGELLNGIGCTSGFVIVKEETGPVGISTAGHCEEGAATDDGVALTFQGKHFGEHRDVQWRTGTQSLPPDFYAGSPTVTETDRRTVTDLGSPVVGQALCKNGRTNHQQCQEVRRLHVCRSSACNMVQMGSRLAAPGDSGGPVYWLTTAYGLHSGSQYDPAWPYDRDYFSRADRLPQALGVHVVK